MSRPASDFSWHLVALAIVIAGLAFLAPLAWRHEGKSAAARSHSARLTLGRSNPNTGVKTEQPAPQLAPIGPLIADQIDLDPSVSETPALPTSKPVSIEEAGPESIDDALNRLEADDVRLSATLTRPVQPLPPLPERVESLRQPAPAPETSPFAIPESAFPPSRGFAIPTALIEQFQSLAQTTPVAKNWAESVIVDVQRLVELPSLADAAIPADLTNLRRLADEARPLAQASGDDQARSRILRAGYALVRRLVIWDMVHGVAVSGELDAAPIVDSHAWHRALGKVDALLHSTGAAANWRKYLLIDRACEEFDSSESSPVDQRQLARDILHRLHSTQLSREQEQFLKTPPFVALDEQLQARASATPDLPALLRAIEQFEHEDTARAGRALAAEFDLLRWSPEAGIRELAEGINAYYRNANIRVALSAELANRMIPAQVPQLEAVDDTILGAWVSGQSQTNTKIHVVLVPDRHRWNVGLEAVGEVASDTTSSKGPATFYQKGWSMFRARKRLTVDRRGVRMFSSEAEANSNTDLHDFETDFDGIPLVSGFIRAIARNQYDSSQPAAKVEVEDKITGRVTSQLDSQVAERLEKTKRDFDARVLKPLRDMNLEPTAVDMETTKERLIARYRLASRDEVSAQTPRPQAPSDSMLSVQVHESALNNFLEQLHLHGRRFELTELHKEVTARFMPGRKAEVPEDLPENVFVTFADEDPIRIDCQDGRVRLTIRLKELAQEGTRNRWTNFTVRAYYAPSADQLDANLYRDGIIELIGDSRPLAIGQRTALTAIFARVLSRNRKLHIINEQIAKAPQLQDQQVTQFVIHDGWMGIALGPKAPGREAAMHPRPELQRE